MFLMSELQWYLYIVGFISLILGCFLYYQIKAKKYSENQRLIRKILMNFFLIISFVTLMYSWL